MSVIELVSANVSKGVWKQFIESQLTQHPDHFRIPQTFSGQEYFKQMLELIAARSMVLDSVAGLDNFIRAVQSDPVRELMWTWLDTYTPIRELESKTGRKEHIVVRDYREKCNLIEGRIHPYYSLRPQPRKHWKRRSTSSTLIIDSQFAQQHSAPAVSELDLQKKLAKLHLNKFITDRSIENRTALIDAINSIPLGTTKRSGSPFLQGGAVGSKR